MSFFTRLSAVFLFCLFSLVAWAGVSCAASLSELEALTDRGVNVLPALAELEELKFRNEHVQADSGVRLFGNAGYGNYKETTTPGASQYVYYRSTNVRAGFSIPLAGTWAKEKMAQLDAQSRLSTAAQQLFIKQSLNRAALRSAWVSRWLELRKQVLLADYVQLAQQTAGRLKERLEARLIVNTDYHDALRKIDWAQQEQSRAAELDARAASVIRLATGRNVSATAMTAPDLPPFAPPELLEAYVRTKHPEVALLQEAADAHANKRDYAGLADFDLRFESSAQAVSEFGSSYGGGIQAGLVLSMPLSVFEARQARQNSVAAASRKALYQASLRQEELSTELAQALRQLSAGQQVGELRERALHFAAAQVDQAQSRGRTFADKGELEWLNALFGQLQARLEVLESVGQWMQAHIEVLRIVEGSDCVPKLPRLGLAHFTGGRQPLLAIVQPEVAAPVVLREPEALPERAPVSPPAKSRAAPAELGVYVWQAGDFLQDKSALAELQAVRAAGFRRLLIAFTPQEIQAIQRDDGALRRLLRRLARRGMRAELLLAEPTWILPEHRADLLCLIERFSSLDFAAIHLDIEQDQLEDAESRRDQYAHLTLETFRVVQEKSRLPVGVSLHPRYLEADGPTPWFAAQLQAIGLHEVVAMIYTTNPSTLLSRLARIQAHAPDLPLSLAQSIEPEPVLSAGESFYTQGKTALHRQFANIRNAGLAGRRIPILIQSWADYRKAKQ